jgi:NhaP-type Na+/H+ or K+/H+ antiporter
MWPMLVAKEAMLEIWHVIEVIGNSLVFFTAGSMTGQCVLHNVSFADTAWLLLLYIAVTVIRFSMLVCFQPILNRLGHNKLSIKDIIVMTWGGLRGMVGLAFAILVRKDLADGQLSQEDGDRVLFLVGGIAALTLIVNASTCPSLVNGLGLTQVPEGRMALVRNVAKRAKEHVETMEKQMIDEAPTGFYCRGAINTCLGRLYDGVDHHISHASGHGKSEEDSAHANSMVKMLFGFL